MAQYDHNAIMKAYPNQIFSIVDGVGVTNKDGEMFEPDAPDSSGKWCAGRRGALMRLEARGAPKKGNKMVLVDRLIELDKIAIANPDVTANADSDEGEPAATRRRMA